jgi:hypothetical protein
MMLNDSFPGTPSFALLALESSNQSLQNNATCYDLDENSLSDILEGDEGNQNKEYDLKPYLRRRHESSSFHWSFEESLEICFGESEGTCRPTSCDDSHGVRLDKSIDSTREFHQRQVSPEPQLKDRHRNIQPHPPNLLDQSISSLTSLDLKKIVVQQCPSEIQFVPEDILRRRYMRLEQSLNLFSPHKSLGNSDSVMLVEQDRHQEAADNLPTPVHRQPSLVETGALSFTDGRRFEGQHLGNYLVRGIMTFPDGTVYRGGWTHGKRDGPGVVEFPDGSRYDGDFELGEYHGHGKLTWSDGGYYIGAWKHGQIQGKGIEVRADGSIRHDGLWKKGHPCRTTPEQPPLKHRTNASPTTDNTMPKTIHVVKWSSMRSLDSTTSTCTSMSTTTPSQAGASTHEGSDDHGARSSARLSATSIHPMDLLAYES